MIMDEITIDQVRLYVSSYTREEIKNHPSIRAGVLVPLLVQNGALNVIFTLRTEDVEHHKGQISFPGGTMDPTDATIVDTALRETEEEIGVTRDAVEILGLLDDYCTPSGFCITPVLGFLPARTPLTANKSEVSEIFEVPLSFFLDPQNERIEQRERFGTLLSVYFYRYGKYEIWGATAEMLRIFLHALTREIHRKKTL
jgi:8-oxo-dGTP pyrophosphatase MutT (NUDIX family)